jgi:hypothetical protein
MSENLSMTFSVNETQTGAHPAGRTLHLVDIENLVGDPVADDESVRAAVAAYKQVAGVRSDDLAVVASNGRLAMAAGKAWPGALLRIGRGPDGADLALLAEATPEWVARRFGRVVIGSGDGIFLDLVRRLRLHGRPVTVVGRPGSIAGKLRRAAEIKVLPDLTDPSGPLGEAA